MCFHWYIQLTYIFILKKFQFLKLWIFADFTKKIVNKLKHLGKQRDIYKGHEEIYISFLLVLTNVHILFYKNINWYLYYTEHCKYIKNTLNVIRYHITNLIKVCRTLLVSTSRCKYLIHRHFSYISSFLFTVTLIIFTHTLQCK